MTKWIFVISCAGWPKNVPQCVEMRLRHVHCSGGPIFALGKSLGSREISWASGMDFPIPLSFWWSTDTRRWKAMQGSFVDSPQVFSICYMLYQYAVFYICYVQCKAVQLGVQGSVEQCRAVQLVLQGCAKQCKIVQGDKTCSAMQYCGLSPGHWWPPLTA